MAYPQPKKIDGGSSLESTYVIHGEMPIGDCIDLMRRERMTALIICDSEFEIDGIFTDRDVFLKIYKSELTKAFWEFPVRVIMSRPVFGLEQSLLHLAAELMVDHNVRHIPIIHKATGGQIEIKGLITQDAVFKSNIKSTKSWRNFTRVQKERMGAAVYSEDRKLVGDIVAAFKTNKNFQVKEIKREELLNPMILGAVIESERSFIIDADRMELRTLTKIFGEIAKKTDADRVLIVSSPENMSVEFLKALKLLQRCNGFQLVLKPVDGGTFLQLFMGPTEFSKNN